MDDLSFLERTTDWHCAMCGASLEQAVDEQFDKLDFTPDELVDGTYARKRKQYMWERTQERPKLTCSRECGYNYKAWKVNLDSKSIYIKGDFTCDLCLLQVTGGRVMVRNGKKIKACRKCHRKISIVKMRLAWEALHHDKRLGYARKYREKKRDKLRGKIKRI